MITQQVQIKINLPLALKEFVESKANRFDMPLAGYIKHLILSDIKHMEYPEYPISDRSSTLLDLALKQRKKAKKVTDIASYLKNL